MGLAAALGQLPGHVSNPEAYHTRLDAHQDCGLPTKLVVTLNIVEYWQQFG